MWTAEKNKKKNHFVSSLTRFLLTAAKALIPRHWKSTKTLSIKEWLLNVQEMYGMEEIRATAFENIEKSNSLWRVWVVYRYSDEYKMLTDT